jgi:hypothetical protein
MSWPDHKSGAITAAIGITALSLLLAPATAQACSCLSVGSACAALGRSSAIFIGTVVSIDPPGGGRGTVTQHVRFEVEEAIKGIDATTVDIETTSDTGSCGYPFRRGTKYLVYAFGDKKALSVSLCSRTGPLEDRRNDLELLRETAAGRVTPRLFGSIARARLSLDGFFFHHEGAGGVPGVPVRVRDGAEVRETRTDAEGNFLLIGLTPGRYVLDVQLPRLYHPLFDRAITANVDDCSGEVVIVAAPITLHGTARRTGSVDGSGRVMLRLAQLGSDGAVAVDRSTIVFTEPDGTWEVAGLPAGRYLLGVNVFNAPTSHTPYPATWYPNALQAKDATVLEVSDDRELSVDFMLPPRIPETTVTGATVGVDGAPIPGASIALHDTAAATDLDVQYTTSDANGRFRIAALRGRHYRIQAQIIRPNGPESELIELSDDAMQSGVTLILKRRK